MKRGVCYYPEQWPEARWAADAKLMQQAGLSLVRIGEFAWAQLEPAEGQFEWSWLDSAIDTLAAHGLQVILGTPTAAPPAWLCKNYPSILPVDQHGQTRRFGSRRHYCLNSPIYLRHTERIVTALAQRYGQHPALAAWQVDNELGCHATARCYCSSCALTFRRWLQERYDSLNNLNQAWGTTFWSQVYGSWDEIEPPILAVTESNPSQVLDYWRFSSDAVVAYLQLQIDLLRQYSGLKPITTNLMGTFSDLDYHDLARPLDLVTWDSYPTGSAEGGTAELYLPGETAPAFAYDVGDPYITGMCHDLMRGLKQAPFWIMEQQAGQINWGNYNPAVRPGTLRLWAWHAAASGAEAIVYFRWRASPYAQEQYHSGLLKHDASPDIGYQEILALNAEQSRLDEIEATPWKAPAALLLNYEDLWSLQLQPHRQGFTYQRLLFLYYRALRQLGINVDIISPEADLSRYPLVIAPTALISTSVLANRLEAYAASGGSLLLGVRSGFKTTSNQVTDQPVPGDFRKLANLRVTSWQSIPPAAEELYQVVSSEIPGLNGSVSMWAEQLAMEGNAAPLAYYSQGALKGSPALAENRIGSGRVYYLGIFPTLLQASAVCRHLAYQAGIPVLDGLPVQVMAVQRAASLLLMNFGEQACQVQVERGKIELPSRAVSIVRLSQLAAPGGSSNSQTRPVGQEIS